MQALTALKTSIVVNMVIGGLLLAAASHPSTAIVANVFADLVFWPFDGNQAANTSTAMFFGGIGGGAFFGWGIASYILADKLLPQQPSLAASILRSGFLSWFCLDGMASILSGAPINAFVFNVVILLSLLVPLHYANQIARQKQKL
jgi:hypothetical protein